MIRMYANTAEQILIALAYVRERIGGNNQRVGVLRDWASHATQGRIVPAVEPEIQRTFNRILERNALDETLNDLIIQLGAQLDAEASPISHDKDLIDTIVRTLQLSYTKNRLSNENLQLLRTAILLPAEQAALRSHIQNEMSCTGCGHKFCHGEMGSFLNESGGGAKVVCTNCYNPEWIACTENVKHSTTAPSGMRKMFHKHSSKCEVCAEEKREGEAGGAAIGSGGADVARIRAISIDDARRVAFGQQYRVRPAESFRSSSFIPPLPPQPVESYIHQNDGPSTAAPPTEQYRAIPSDDGTIRYQHFVDENAPAPQGNAWGARTITSANTSITPEQLHREMMFGPATISGIDRVLQSPIFLDAMDGIDRVDVEEDDIIDHDYDDDDNDRDTHDDDLDIGEED